ncbi:MAG: coniferyl aldehyde dehydrogenase [Cellvibrionaceae bacterium]|nr:coniferyl aldehyde dehydrogenase [Cellvibrionaceae bacterium]|tara:strand:+ start:25367 stop:26842 length:1476 start_codon:yes stop_codon:yes gene_type:complete
MREAVMEVQAGSNLADADDVATKTSEMVRVLDAQGGAFVANGYPTLEQRRDRLDRAIALLEENRQQLCDAVKRDYGHRPEFQTTVADIFMALDSLKYCRKHTKKWMRRENRGAKFPFNILGAKAYIHYQPVGVVGIVAPWNFPIQLTFSPLANALSAGNRVMIKPSELTPHTSELLQNLVAKYFDETQVSVFTGGVDIAEAFSGLAFDHLVFTGAPSVGKHVMAAAAKNLVPVTLELGGKCPVIAGEGVNVKELVERVMTFKTLNVGQICLAPDTLFIKKELLGEFIELAKGWVRECFPDFASNPDYASIINERHYQRLMSYVTQAQALDVEVVGLAAEGDIGDSGGRKIQPTLFIDPPDHSLAMLNEIFGPLMPVKTYSDIGEVIDYLNRNERPLGLYYFGRSRTEIDRFQYETVSGGMVVNDVASHVLQDNMPLGGVGHSGMGSYHGFDGFKRLSHARGTYEQGLFSAAGLFKAPYKASTLKLISKIMG